MVVAARLEVADQPRARAGRARRRPVRRTPGAALARHRADGRRADAPSASTVDTAGDDWPVTPGPLRGPRRRRLRAGRHGDAVRAAGRRARRRPVLFDGDPHARDAADGRDAQRAARARRRRRRRRPRSLPFTVDGTGLGPRRHGRRSTPRRRASSSRRCCWPAPGTTTGVDVRHDGKPVPSLPHIDDDRRDAARARRRGRRRRAEPLAGRARAGRAPSTYAIEPDLSNAAPFLAAGAGHRRHGHRAATGRARPPRPATRCARSSR